MKPAAFAVALTFLLSAASPAQQDLWQQPTLTGSWNGIRTDLADAGIEIGGLYRSDNLSNAVGGIARNSAYIHNIDLTISVDADKAIGWKGGALYFHMLSNNGGKINPSVGDCQMVSSIEAAKTTKVYQLWIQQETLDQSLSLRMGLYDLNSEFYVTQSSALFLNASHGIGKEVAQTGKNGPSIFPNTALGIRLKFLPIPALTVQAVALNGVPGDPDDPLTTSFRIDEDDGAFLDAEVGWSPTAEDDSFLTRIAVGAWTYTARFPRYVSNDNDISMRRNHGYYLLAEHQLAAFGNVSTRGITAFVRLGAANGEINRFKYHLGVGAVATGIFDARSDDQLGIAVAHAHNSSEYLDWMRAQGTPVRHSEVSFETTYRCQLTPFWAIQPDVQWVFNPGTEPGRPNALVIGARLEVKL